MDREPVEILKENLSSINLSLKRLIYSYETCKKTGLKETYSEDEFVDFEAMTARYARTTDMLINKVLRSLDTVEYIDSGTIIDAVNNAEKRGIADSQKLRELKELRNSIAHEYIAENIVRFFGDVLELTPQLQIVIENVNKYCERYLGK